MANFPEESGFIPQARASTFALPRFGMDGKDGDGDTCFFAHLISFLAIFSGFCPYVTGFLPLCHLCLKYLKPRYGNCNTCHTGVAAPGLLSWSLIQKQEENF